MRTTTMAIATVAAFGFSAVQASAATLLFDGFDINQGVADTPINPFTTSDTIAFGTGTRTLEVENIQNNGGSTEFFATQLSVASSRLSFSNSDGATGIGTVTYTDVGDIELGANGYFLFEIVGGAFDKIANFNVYVEDMAGHISTYTEVLLPGFDNKLLFSAFTGSADFNMVKTLSFQIDSENINELFGGPNTQVDGSLASISIGAVPLPASALLLLGGLGGLGAMRRRKNKATA
jgi:hypothetical protein